MFFVVYRPETWADGKLLAAAMNKVVNNYPWFFSGVRFICDHTYSFNTARALSEFLGTFELRPSGNRTFNELSRYQWRMTYSCDADQRYAGVFFLESKKEGSGKICCSHLCFDMYQWGKAAKFFPSLWLELCLQGWSYVHRQRFVPIAARPVSIMRGDHVRIYRELGALELTLYYMWPVNRLKISLHMHYRLIETLFS